MRHEAWLPIYKGLGVLTTLSIVWGGIALMRDDSGVLYIHDPAFLWTLPPMLLYTVLYAVFAKTDSRPPLYHYLDGLTVSLAAPVAGLLLGAVAFALHWLMSQIGLVERFAY